MFNLSDDGWDYPKAPVATLPSRAAITAGLTPAQAAAAAHDGAILVLAGAGTGKTKTLTAGVALGDHEEVWGSRDAGGLTAVICPGAQTCEAARTSH